MPDAIAPRPALSANSRPNSLPLWLIGAVFAVAAAGTVLLWAHYGTTVFFETIRAGFVACFG